MPHQPYSLLCPTCVRIFALHSHAVRCTRCDGPLDQMVTADALAAVMAAARRDHGDDADPIGDAAGMSA